MEASCHFALGNQELAFRSSEGESCVFEGILGSDLVVVVEWLVDAEIFGVRESQGRRQEPDLVKAFGLALVLEARHSLESEEHADRSA